MQDVKIGLLCVFRVTGVHGAEDAMVAEDAAALASGGCCAVCLASRRVGRSGFRGRWGSRARAKELLQNPGTSLLDDAALVAASGAALESTFMTLALPTWTFRCWASQRPPQNEEVSPLWRYRGIRLH